MKTAVALLGLLVMLGTPSACAAGATPNVQIAQAVFGLFDSYSNTAQFTPSNAVPMKVGQVYGWRIFLKTAATSVRFREVFKLPAAPHSWGTAEAGKMVSGDFTTSTIERDVPVTNGYIEHRWNVAAGDPSGTYVITVSVDGAPAATFEFVVQ
ncbi:MAG: hypothetical protein ABSD74_00445 [Rhizomicrobium sp.]|jgi:hypothetical protein